MPPDTRDPQQPPPWTDAHEVWLRRQRFDDVHLKAAFDHGFDAVLAATAARDRLDEQIAEVAASPRFADPVNRLGCLRGISALTGLAWLAWLAWLDPAKLES